MRIADYLDTAAARRPSKECLVFGDNRMSCREVQRHVHAIAHAPHETPGLDDEAQVAIYSPNDIRIPLLQLGTNRGTSPGLRRTTGIRPKRTRRSDRSSTADWCFFIAVISMRCRR